MARHASGSRFCGVCGSDLHRFRGDLPLVSVTPGHEISGVVDAIGADVSSVGPGDRVCVEPVVPCGRCPYCSTGHHQLCGHARFLAGEEAGGFADYVCVPEQMLHRVPATIPLEQAALVEPLAVSVHAVRQGRVGRGSSVCVLGAGTIGLLVLQVAQASGAGQVLITAKRLLITAKRPHQAEAARALGADGVIIVGSRGRIRIGNTLFPELYTIDSECEMALTKRAFPGSVVAKSPMTTAVEELIRALETGEAPASDLTDARADLELSVAFHLADRARAVVALPVTDVNYSITDPWGRYG